MDRKTIFIRRETHPNEYRTPLVPRDIERLILAGFTVYIQKSADRIFSDDEYEQIGAILTEDEWYTAPPESLILGIKELSALEKLNHHTHAYFSHSYKGQTGATEILQAFRQSQSNLYDFEFFTSPSGKRLISFGWYAGAVGAVLGLQKQWKNLTPWSSIDTMFASVERPTTETKIAVIGWQGRCGTGVCDILDTLNVTYSRFGRNDTLDTLCEYDIVYNCILLDPSYTKVWFSPTGTPSTKPITVVDISCDYSKANNPIAIYKEATTWESPVIEPEEKIRVIAIENLPSLLPKESSEHFSSILTEFLLDIRSTIWERTLQRFYEALSI